MIKNKAIILLSALILSFCWMGTAMALDIKSAAFSNGAAIPRQYTCEGRDISPELQWEGAPAGTLSFALICDDPDAPMGTWVHWVIYNIPAATQGLPEGVATVGSLKDGSQQGFTDFQRTGYGGPCPPAGKPHRYFFRLYALDSMLAIKGKVTKESLLSAMQGHILAEAGLMGTYKR